MTESQLYDLNLYLRNNSINEEDIIDCISFNYPSWLWCIILWRLLESKESWMNKNGSKTIFNSEHGPLVKYNLISVKQVTITNCNTNCETVYSRKNWAREFVFFPLIGACYTVCKNKIQAVFIHLIMACYTVCKILNPLHGA